MLIVVVVTLQDSQLCKVTTTTISIQNYSEFTCHDEPYALNVRQ